MANVTIPVATSEQPSCANNPDKVKNVRAFYTYGVDLADFEDVAQSSILALQRLRADAALPKLYEDKLKNVEGFENVSRNIEQSAEQAVRLGGKKVWSETFLQSRAPWTTPVSREFKLAGDVYSPKATIPNGHLLRNWYFDSANGYLTPDGVLVLTLSFRQDEEIEVSGLIACLRRLAEVADGIFKQHASNVVAPGTSLHAVLTDLGFSPGTVPITEKVRAHRTVFVGRFFCPLGKHCDAHRIRNSSAVAGIMNLAVWYPEYHQEYRERLALKEFGYKASELYLTDKDATLAVQAGFWDEKDSLKHYLGNVLEAVEYHVGVHALLRGQLQYARNLYSLTASKDLDSDAAVEGVRTSRAILAGAYESLNYPVLVLHGFTRLLLNSLDRESGITSILEDVERRVENVSDAVSLQTSVSIGKVGNSTNARLVWMTLVLVVLTIVLVVLTIAMIVT